MGINSRPSLAVVFGGDPQGNPALGYLKCLGMALCLNAPLASSYLLNTPTVALLLTPLCVLEILRRLQKFNPIHTNTHYYSNFSSLPATKAHGMWPNTAARFYIESCSSRLS